MIDVFGVVLVEIGELVELYLVGGVFGCWGCCVDFFVEIECDGVGIVVELLDWILIECFVVVVCVFIIEF